MGYVIIPQIDNQKVLQYHSHGGPIRLITFLQSKQTIYYFVTREPPPPTPK